MKAFVVNRVGDFGFALGIFGAFVLIRLDLSFDGAFAGGFEGRRFGQDHAVPRLVAHCRVDALTVICLLLFMGAMGKSAQFLLHTWLAGRHGRPDAGLGPHPCRDDGDGRRLHGGAPVAAVRAVADGADRS
jgi:NADH-quinone oxidoreductase subunit L